MGKDRKEVYIPWLRNIKGYMFKWWRIGRRYIYSMVKEY